MFRKGSLYGLPYPSWSWLSTTESVSFMDPCGDSIVSEVTWHEPFRLGDEVSARLIKSVYPTVVSSSNEDWQKLGALSTTTSETQSLDYGLLHFTALTTKLILRPSQPVNHISTSSGNQSQSGETGPYVKMEETNVHKTKSPNEWIEVSVHASNGDTIGKMVTPFQFFGENSECFGEFVLLSSNARHESNETCKKMDGLDCGTIMHIHGCSHIESQNIMLIEWSEHIAYRRGLITVRKEN